jgi:5-(carboxyamino)imidazole ribonucleotide synthase
MTPTLGILGGGQLGRMLALAALPMGVRVRFLVDTPADPIADFADVTVADWTDPDVLSRWAQTCDAVTVESEWAPADLLAQAAPDARVFPSPDTLRTIRDKALQKRSLADAGLATPPFRVCGTRDELHAAADTLGFPLMAKRRRGSYDGYGNATCRTPEDLDAAWDDLAQDDGLLAEAWAPFEAELSVLVARWEDGQTVVYPVAFSEQRDHRCHAVVVPSGVDKSTEQRARELALSAVEAVGAVGIVGVELFALPSGEVSVNELAPRPHNTGHYTIEACATSQFEQHVRAVLSLPPGSAALRRPAACMVNLLGRRDGPLEASGYSDLLAEPGVHVHLYGKRDVRARRKMGHVTVLDDTPHAARARAESAADRLTL